MVDRFNKYVIREIIAILSKLEVDRSVLSSRPDFTIQRSFELLTPHSNLDKLSQGDLVATLNHLGITCTLADAELLIRRYDGDFDGKLSFWEFQNIFMPVNPVARQKIEQRNK